MPAPSEARPTDPRLVFDQAAATYHDARPAYPQALFDRLGELLPANPDILEVGPGTGQATEPLLDRGAKVQAVELGPSLAAALISRLGAKVELDQLAVEVADFEQVPIQPASVDAVVSATAFHWISPAAQLDRPRRWLREGGRLAIVDTMQVESEVDGGYYASAQPIYARYGQGTSDAVPSPADVRPPMHRRMTEASECSEVTLDRFRWDQTYTAEAYGRLLSTFSGPLTLEPIVRSQMIGELVELVRVRGGRVTRPLVITLATCRFETPVSGTAQANHRVHRPRE